MTKERLQSLSYKSLLEIAERDHLAYDEGIEKETQIKLFDAIEIDVNNDNNNDISVRISIYPYIERPLRLSFNFRC